MPEGEETHGERPPREIERDLLAQRRAQRESADPMLTRRAQAAEATVSNLEAHIVSLERRLQESVEERDELTRELAGRELEVRRVKQREHAEQQLRVEAEDNRERSSREMQTQVEEMRLQLAATERQAGELGSELERVRRELSEVQQAMALGDPTREWTAEMHERLGALEARAEEASRELARERAGRESAERQLQVLWERDRRLVAIVRELIGATGDLRVDFERELDDLAEQLRGDMAGEEEASVLGLTGLSTQIEALRAELGRAVQALRSPSSAEPAVPALGPVPHTEHGEPATGERSVDSPEVPDPSQTPRSGLEVAAQWTQSPGNVGIQDEQEELRRQAMADALAAAVERLRARVAHEGELPLSPRDPLAELGPPEVEEAEEQGERLPWELAVEPPQRPPWLAPAIRGVARRYGAESAAALLIELIPTQRLALDRELRYELRIEDLGSFLVELGDGRGKVSRVEEGKVRAKVDFRLQGHLEDLVVLAAGGSSGRLKGVRTRGSRRAARALRKALRGPLAVADLVEAGVDPEPQLLLAALCEAIDPRLTLGQRFTVAYLLDGAENRQLYVHVNEGGPVLLSSGPDTADPENESEPVATVRVGGRSLLHLIAGLAPPVGERASVIGDVEAVRLLMRWMMRAQGLDGAER